MFAEINRPKALNALNLGGMGRRQANWPTIGQAAFATDGIRAIAGSLVALQRLDLSHSQATNLCVLALAKGCPELALINLLDTRCTREVFRMLRQVGCHARVFGI